MTCHGTSPVVQKSKKYTPVIGRATWGVSMVVAEPWFYPAGRHAGEGNAPPRAVPHLLHLTRNLTAPLYFCFTNIVLLSIQIGQIFNSYLLMLLAFKTGCQKVENAPQSEITPLSPRVGWSSGTTLHYDSPQHALPINYHSSLEFIRRIECFYFPRIFIIHTNHSPFPAIPTVPTRLGNDTRILVSIPYR